MIIHWHGQSFFTINTKNKTGEKIVLAIDPFAQSSGLRPPKKKADILLISHSHKDHSNKQIITGNPFVIQSPGEYEKEDIFIYGIQAFHDQKQGKERGQVVVYKILAEGMHLCHLGDFGQKELSADQIEKIGEVDVLMIPVGSEKSLNAKGAARVIAQIEPRLVVPMHYKIKGSPGDLEGVDKFLKAMGAEKTKPEPQLKIRRNDPPGEETRIVVLGYE